MGRDPLPGVAFAGWAFQDVPASATLYYAMAHHMWGGAPQELVNGEAGEGGGVGYVLAPHELFPHPAWRARLLAFGAGFVAPHLCGFNEVQIPAGGANVLSDLVGVPDVDTWFRYLFIASMGAAGGVRIEHGGVTARVGDYDSSQAPFQVWDRYLVRSGTVLTGQDKRVLAHWSLLGTDDLDSIRVRPCGIQLTGAGAFSSQRSVQLPAYPRTPEVLEWGQRPTLYPLQPRSRGLEIRGGTGAAFGAEVERLAAVNIPADETELVVMMAVAVWEDDER